MPSHDLDQEWSRSPDAVLPWTVLTRSTVRFGKVEIVEYDGGPARRLQLLPRDSILEMMLSPPGGRIARSGAFDHGTVAHPLGHSVFLPAGHHVTIDWPEIGPVRAIRCHYHGAEAHRVFSAQELVAGLAVTSPALVTAVMTLAQELVSPGFQSPLLAESLVAQVAVELGRYLRRDAYAGSPHRLTAQQMAMIDRRIEAGPGVPLAEDLADLCQLSRRHFFRLFRQTTGSTPASYIATRQIERAQLLLRAEGAVIKRIANECGFRTASAFSAAFRRQTGMTPRAFQIAVRP